jgi:glycine/D-amino acid oxidase-like deaminating enzyme/nitrite reductase/ring-hydroxylating ferredoxin subunit
MENNQQNAFQQSPEPFWRESVKLLTFPKLEENTKADVGIVGGGIAGLTAAYLLSKAGKNVVLIEANQILNGTTGHTTAKITAQHGLLYDELIQHFGEEFAKKYYHANMDALQFIKQTATEIGADCNLTEQDAYVYATTDEYSSKVTTEYEAYRRLGIPGEIVEEIPIDLPIKNAVIMKNQAQFHPLKYFKKLVEAIVNQGGKIYEGTTATDIQEKESTKIVTRDGYHVDCQNVLVCSHFPFYDGKGFYFTRLEPERSYILGVKTKKEYPGGMYINAESPTRSLRYTEGEDGEKLVLIGGDNHKTGQGKDTMEHYRALEDYGEEVLGIEEVRYRWSAQDLTSLDKVPYIGPITEKHPSIFVATGFKKWGMSSGTLSAQILADAVLGERNIYSEVFSPSRFAADPSVKKLVKANANVAGKLISGKLEVPTKKPEDLKEGEGAVVNAEGRRCGGYRSKDGKIHLVDTTCTHMGCEVEWNHGDTTWDCPCHGSRFTIEGEVVEGPAKKPLTKLN